MVFGTNLDRATWQFAKRRGDHRACRQNAENKKNAENKTWQIWIELHGDFQDAKETKGRVDKTPIFQHVDAT